MASRWIAVLTGIVFAVSGCGRKSVEPKVTFGIEITADETAAGAEFSLEEAGEWFQEILSESTDLPKRDIQYTLQEPGHLNLAVPASHSLWVTEILRLLAPKPNLSFHLVHARSSALKAEVQAGEKSIPDYHLMPSIKGTDGGFLITIVPDVSGDLIESIRREYSADGWVFAVNFNEDGASLMGAFTKKHLKEQLAIVLGDRVLTAPVIQGAFSSSCQITGGGNFNEYEAAALEIGLENPPRFSFEVIYSASSGLNPDSASARQPPG